MTFWSFFYIWLCFLCAQVLWELRDNGDVCPQSLEVMLQF